MKKAIIILIVLFTFITAVSAANDQAGPVEGKGDKATPARTLVSLDLSSSENNIVEFWFSDKASNGGRRPESAKGEVKLKQNAGSSEFSNTAANETLYACWYIRSTEAIDVSLWLDQPLQDPDETASIRWKVSGTNPQLLIDSGTETKSDDVVSYTANAALEANSVQLTVETVDNNWAAIPAGKKYTAYITLGVQTT